MAVSTQEPVRENQTDRYPLLTEPCDDNTNNEHIIHIERGNGASSSGLPELNTLDSSPSHPPTGSSTQFLNHRSLSYSSTRTSSRSSSFGRRHDRMGRSSWSPFNSGLWITIELIFTMSQIMASVIVLSLSRNEKPKAPLFSWVVGYTFGCCTSIPIIYWRYLHRNNQNTEQGASSPNQDSPHASSASDRNSYVTISLGHTSNQDDHPGMSGASYNNSQASQPINPRLSLIMDHLKMALDCFFAVWFVVGNVWIFGGRSSAADAPNLYRLCIVYLTLSCIGYAMPFILCAMICCCLPCIISLLGIREDQNQVQGASEECINALPTHKFKSNKDENGFEEGLNGEEVEGGGRGGIVAAGTENERAISSEDAVCCICLASYVDNDVLRELPCSHFFHLECVDRWLKINATCPLCKAEIISRSEDPPQPQTEATPQQSEGNSSQQT